MPPKKHDTKPALANNPFEPLSHQMEMEERKEKKELHQEFDETWKLLIRKRQKCRSLQYQFWAAVLIEDEGSSEGSDGLKDLIESILIDSRMGDQHIATLPGEYRYKMSQCIKKISLEEKTIKGDVTKFLAFLEKWHSDLENEIKQKCGDNYKIKIGLNEDGSDKYIINPVVREQIKEIIKNNVEAKKIRDQLNLSTRLQLEEKAEKLLPLKDKTGMDHYIDYLLEENDKKAQESLNKAAELGYVDNFDKGDAKKKQSTIISDEYYLNIFSTFYNKKDFKRLESVMKSAADKDSAMAQYFLATTYYSGCGPILPDKNKAIKYYKLSAENGYAEAQHYLGITYIKNAENVKDSVKIKEDNIAKGLTWLKIASSQDYAPSHSFLGILHNRGKLIPANKEEAKKYWEKGALQGDLVSKYFLGSYYIEKYHVTAVEINTDMTNKGIKLMTEAAEEGLPMAQHYLAFFNIKILKDVPEALKWYEEAAKQKNAEAIAFLKDNKDYLDLVRSANKNPQYYISLFNPHENENAFNVRYDMLVELLTSRFGLDESYIKIIKDGPNWEGVKLPLPSGELKKDLRDLLGIERVKIDKLTAKELEALRNELPKATFENDPDNSNKMFITWPIYPEINSRKVIDRFIKESKSPPRTIAKKPVARVASGSEDFKSK